MWQDFIFLSLQSQYIVEGGLIAICNNKRSETQGMFYTQDENMHHKDITCAPHRTFVTHASRFWNWNMIWWDYLVCLLHSCHIEYLGTTYIRSVFHDNKQCNTAHCEMDLHSIVLNHEKLCELIMILIMMLSKYVNMHEICKWASWNDHITIIIIWS